MGTQGFMQGAQLKLQRDRAQREQAAYEQALKEAQFKLGQEQSQATAQQQAGDLIGQIPTQIKNNGGAVGLNGPVLPSEQSRQDEFNQLQQHHQEVMKQAGAIAGKLDPRYVQQFWSDINAGMKQDAMNLARIHVGDSLHDAIANGSLDIVDPRTGERVPSPEVQQQFGDMADRVKSGDLDPIQAQQALDQTRAKLNAEAGQVQQRLMLAEGAMQQLQEAGPAVITPFQLSTIDALKTGQISAEQWQGMAPYVLGGFIPDPSGGRGWMTPEHAQQVAAEMKAKTHSIEATASYTEQRPGLEASKIANQSAAIEQRSKSQNENLQFRKDKQAQDDQTKRDLSKQRIEAEIAKSATQAGYSDEKAYHQAVQDASTEFKNGAIKDEDAYKARLDELYQKYKPKAGGKLSPEERARQFLNKPK